MLERFEHFVQILTRRTAQVAQAAMFIAMMIIVANVIMRVAWRPLGGTVELVEMAGAVLLALGVAYTAMMRGHIMVGVLVERLPRRVQGVVETAVNSLALVFSFLLARELFFYAYNMMGRGYQTGHLKIPIAPSIFLVALGFVMLALVLLLNLVKAVSTLLRGSAGG